MLYSPFFWLSSSLIWPYLWEKKPVLMCPFISPLLFLLLFSFSLIFCGTKVACCSNLRYARIFNCYLLDFLVVKARRIFSDRLRDSVWLRVPCSHFWALDERSCYPALVLMPSLSIRICLGCGRNWTLNNCCSPFYRTDLVYLLYEKCLCLAPGF